jgi:hypothetical protein
LKFFSKPVKNTPNITNNNMEHAEMPHMYLSKRHHRHPLIEYKKEVYWHIKN